MKDNRCKKILIVEDEKVTARVEADILERNNYEVTTVCSGEDALEAIKTDPSIDLVIMDINLGEGIDGTEAAKHILEVRRLPIVFLTSHAEREIVEKVHGITRYGYVLKDYGAFVLQSSIEMAFELFEAHMQLEKKNEELIETYRKRQESEVRYHSLFQNMLDGFAYCRMLFDDHDRPVDFVYLDVNQAFDQLTGLKDVIGKRVTEVIPGIRELNPELFEIYGRVASKGSSEKFEIDFKPLAMCLSVSVHSNEKGYFVATFENITERRQAEEKIKSLLAEKELLLREVHHRVKNNMNVIMSLLSLQSQALKDQSAVSSLEDARSRVQSMMVLYDKLYRSSDFRKISTREYLSALIDEIVGIFPARRFLTIEKHIDDLVLDSEILSPLGMIINELLTNAMKHSFPGRDKGIITVSLSKKDNEGTLIIEDNGIGVSETIDIAAPEGFGLQLVGMLAEQLGGTIRLERQKGAKFIVEFKA
ncbi:MAG: histidine kinase dimerization/phosphoacceptor domain -containing protein [Candidatus Eremiobacteraeota bacterium]|nr:histidine kinase dimerization/phosphoacceptor domain -containing protein [Candidatus Eremiobacteraeota bacterium]